ncbi:MAG: hypothetical protein WEB09_06825 [Nitriliruptor sp.]|uniref:hypothetical protein n=1 Tax=Nitriliruptor sp. TaxID=2448056 RepID=UPI0034A06747
MRSLFVLAVGLGAGVLVGGYVVRKVDRATRAAHPVALADRAGRAAGSLQSRLAAAAEAGRVAAADREAQLRRDYDLDPLHELTAQAPLPNG